MHQLSGLDATFLYLETPEMPMHVGALHIFDLPAGHPGRFVTALRKHMATRLPVAPVLRRRLWWMPLNLANPAWVDADPDLKQHIVEVKLPPSARLGDGRRELEAEIGRLHSVLLDRSRPLWKFHVLEGLGPSPEGRKRVALYTQLHHAAVDGQAAVALANAILDLSPEGRLIDVRPSRRHKTFELGMTEMLRGVLGSQAQKVAGIIRDLPGTVGTLKTAASKAASSAMNQAVTRLGLPGGDGKKGSGNLSLAPRTALNVSVGPGRAFASLTLPLRDLKALARAHGATLNDVVLMLCSTALRRYFLKRRALPRKSLVAAVPISLRPDAATAPGEGNQASMSLVSLGTNIADTMQRLHHVQAASKAMKSTMGGLKSVLPTDFPSLGVPWLIEAATALYGKARVADRIPQLANLVISNVPGPSVPLFLAGAKMVTNYPASIIVHGLALNITVQSYDQSLDFGLMADAAAMPQVRELADAIGIAYDDLCALPRPGEAGHPDTTAPQSLASRATRAATRAATQAGRQMGGAVTGAVSGAVVGAVGKLASDMAKAARKRRAD
jgi:diacylglycerol O-acyltransferase / wax synthase